MNPAPISQGHELQRSEVLLPAVRCGIGIHRCPPRNLDETVPVEVIGILSRCHRSAANDDSGNACACRNEEMARGILHLPACEQYLLSTTGEPNINWLFALHVPSPTLCRRRWQAPFAQRLRPVSRLDCCQLSPPFLDLVPRFVLGIGYWVFQRPIGRRARRSRDLPATGSWEGGPSSSPRHRP
jgi:hypothetical protein